MRSFSIAAALSGLVALSSAQAVIDGRVTGVLGDAAIVNDNPVGVTYTATLLEKNTTTVRGSISGSAAPNGTGVIFKVNFFGFPSTELAPYIYHIHDQPVPSNGNCTATLAHQDPYIRGEIPPCDPTQPQTCQVGDLSGKHGNITTLSYTAEYLDLYASTKQGLGSFFGNRSIVVHTANTTRLNCANFTLDATNGTVTPRPTDGRVLPTGPTSPPFTGAASTLGSGMTLSALLGGLMAAFMLA